MVADDPESFADLDGHCGHEAMPGTLKSTPCSNASTQALDGDGFGDGNSGINGLGCSLVSCTSSADVSAQSGQTSAQQQAGNNANNRQAQNEGQISLTLGDTNVTGEYSFGGIAQLSTKGLPMLGAAVDATADCAGCFWAQTISNTGNPSNVQGTRTDAPLGKDSPLLVTGFTSGETYHDTPAREKGTAGASTLVAILGTASPKNHTFSAKGAMTYGYSVDRQGKVTGSAPRVATKKELAHALAVVRREYPGWRIH